MYANARRCLEDFARWGVEYTQSLRYIAQQLRDIEDEAEWTGELRNPVYMLRGNITYTLKDARGFIDRCFEYGTELGYDMSGRNDYRVGRDRQLMAMSQKICATCRTAQRRRYPNVPAGHALRVRYWIDQYNRLQKIMNRKTIHDSDLIRTNNWTELDDYLMELNSARGVARVSFNCAVDTLVNHRVVQNKTWNRRQMRRDYFDTDTVGVAWVGHRRGPLCATCAAATVEP